jgi:hypothetical protein
MFHCIKDLFSTNSNFLLMKFNTALLAYGICANVFCNFPDTLETGPFRDSLR